MKKMLVLIAAAGAAVVYYRRAKPVEEAATHGDLLSSVHWARHSKRSSLPNQTGSAWCAPQGLGR